MTCHLVIDGHRMPPEKLLLQIAGTGFERRPVGLHFTPARALLPLQKRFDFGEVFAGGFGITGKRGAERGFGGGRRGPTDGKFLHSILP
jgi:hypothetical protein